MAPVPPFLMFQHGDAEQARRFGVSLFADGTARYWSWSAAAQASRWLNDRYGVSWQLNLP